MPDFAARRTTMVDTQIRPSDVTKYPIIEAMLEVERERFVPEGQIEAAYSEDPISLPANREMLEPRTLAKMLDLLDIRDDELVLVIGCGTGYSSAVISRLAQAVVAVEEDEEMATEAETRLADAGVDNTAVHVGPLAQGAREHGPYDVIIIEGAVEHLPTEIADQLKEGGRICCLFLDRASGSVREPGAGQYCDVRLGRKLSGHISWRFEFNAGAAVLPGFRAQRTFAL